MMQQGKLDLLTLALLVGTIVVLSGGQILFKFAASGLHFGQPRTLLSVPLLAALVVYGIATVMWLLVLTRAPLSVAFPFYGITFLLVPLLAAFFLGEPLRMHTLLGGAIILIGIVVCTKGAA
jgi:drug/metabolite transporter (DMT)-like permease